MKRKETTGKENLEATGRMREASAIVRAPAGQLSSEVAFDHPTAISDSSIAAPSPHPPGQTGAVS